MGGGGWAQESLSGCWPLSSAKEATRSCFLFERTKGHMKGRKSLLLLGRSCPHKHPRHSQGGVPAPSPDPRGGQNWERAGQKFTGLTSQQLPSWDTTTMGSRRAPQHLPCVVLCFKLPFAHQATQPQTTASLWLGQAWEATS